MSESNVIDKIEAIRIDLDSQAKLLNEQMELPLNEANIKNSKSVNNSVKLSRGVAFSKWVRRMTSQFESVDPFYK